MRRGDNGYNSFGGVSMDLEAVNSSTTFETRAKSQSLIDISLEIMYTLSKMRSVKTK